MKRGLLSLLILASTTIFAQNIKVIDMETSFAIQNINVKSVNGKLTFHTNERGIINIRNFRKKDTLVFSHPNYETYRITKRQIIKNKYVVEMLKKYQKLDNVILSVSRTKNKKKSIAKQVKVIDRIETKKIMPGTSADLLEKSGDIVVQKTQGGAGSPIIRGLEANRVLLVVDGIRLNNAISRTGHLHTAITLSPLILQRTEVIYGPSSIYGSDALGGVINFYTKTPTINSYKKLTGGIIGRYASANNETTFNANATISQLSWASSFDFSFSDFGDIRMGSNRIHGYKNWGVVDKYSLNTNRYYRATANINTDKTLQPQTAYQQKDFFNKTVIDLGKHNELLFNTQLNLNSSINRFDKLTQQTDSGELKYAEWRYGPSQRLLFSPQLLLHFDKKWLKKANIILAYQDINESRIHRKFSSLDQEHQEENVKVLSFNADFNTHFKNKSVFSYGLESTYNKVQSKAYSKTLIVDGHSIIGSVQGPPVPTRYPDGGSTYMNFAAYGNYRYHLSNKSNINAGVRYTQTYVRVKWIDNTFINLPYNDNELANYAFTGDLSYIFSPKNWKISALASSGFRSPNVDDIGKIREKKGKVTVPNIYLKPEYAYNGEMNITRFFNHQKFSVSAGGYFSYLYHYITRDKFSLQPGVTDILYDGEWAETYANVNSGDARIYGGSFTINGKLSKRITLESGVFYTKGRMIDADRPMPSIPPLYGNSTLTYKYKNFESSLMYRFMLDKPVEEYDVIGGIDNLDESPFNPSSGTYAGFPKWHIFNLYGTYHLNKNFSVYLAIENIFDVHYKEFASAVSAPGRNFKVQLISKL